MEWCIILTMSYIMQHDCLKWKVTLLETKLRFLRCIRKGHCNHTFISLVDIQEAFDSMDVLTQILIICGFFMIKKQQLTKKKEKKIEKRKEKRKTKKKKEEKKMKKKKNVQALLKYFKCEEPFSVYLSAVNWKYYLEVITAVSIILWKEHSVFVRYIHGIKVMIWKWA